MHDCPATAARDCVPLESIVPEKNSIRRRPNRAHREFICADPLLIGLRDAQFTTRTENDKISLAGLRIAMKRIRDLPSGMLSLCVEFCV